MREDTTMQRQDAIGGGDQNPLADAELVQLARKRDSGAFRVIMQVQPASLSRRPRRHPAVGVGGYRLDGGAADVDTDCDVLT